jgi:hypothetical protein
MAEGMIAVGRSLRSLPRPLLSMVCCKRVKRRGMTGEIELEVEIESKRGRLLGVIHLHTDVYLLACSAQWYTPGESERKRGREGAKKDQKTVLSDLSRSLPSFSSSVIFGNFSLISVCIHL